jgi:hypothetical protein
MDILDFQLGLEIGDHLLRVGLPLPHVDAGRLSQACSFRTDVHAICIFEFESCPCAAFERREFSIYL